MKYLTVNVLATVVFIYIEFDDLTHFKKICMVIVTFEIGFIC